MFHSAEEAGAVNSSAGQKSGGKHLDKEPGERIIRLIDLTFASRIRNPMNDTGNRPQKELPLAAPANGSSAQGSRLKRIDHSNPIPKWHQLRNILRERIEAGGHSPEKPFCTQAELMKNYNVSHATVTRALNELVRHGYIYRKTGMGTFVREVGKRRTAKGSLGLLVWQGESTLRHPAFSRLIAGLSDPLGAGGYGLSFIFVNPELISSRRVASVVRDAGVCALIAPFQPMLREEDFLPLAQDREFPIVFLNLDFPRASPYSISFDIARAVYDATMHLVRGGYETVVLSVPANEEGPEYRKGYAQAMQECERTLDPGLVQEVALTIESGAAAAEKILGGASPRVGVVAGDDLVGIGLLRKAQALGWSIPEQFGCVAVGDFLSADLSPIPLTAVQLRFADMGRMAGKLAMQLLRGERPPAHRRLIEPQLITRDSTRSIECEPRRQAAESPGNPRR